MTDFSTGFVLGWVAGVTMAVLGLRLMFWLTRRRKTKQERRPGKRTDGW